MSFNKLDRVTLKLLVAMQHILSPTLSRLFICFYMFPYTIQTVRPSILNGQFTKNINVYCTPAIRILRFVFGEVLRALK